MERRTEFGIAEAEPEGERPLAQFVPTGVTLRIVRFPMSATNKLPLASTAIPAGA